MTIEKAWNILGMEPGPAKAVLEAMIHLGKPAEAEALVLGAIEKEEDVHRISGYRFLLGLIYIIRKKYQECLNLVSDLLEEDPDFTAAYILRQEVSFRRHDIRQVVDDYPLIIGKYPDVTRPYLLAIRVFLEQNQPKDALSVLNKAKENKAVDPALRYEEIRYLRRLEQSQFTLSTITVLCDELKTQIADQPADPFVFPDEFITEKDVSYQLISAYSDYGQNDFALEMFENCELQNLKDRRFIQLHGRILYELGRCTEATRCYNQLKAKDSSDPELYYLLALCYLKQKLPGSAVENLKKAVELNPSYEDALHELASFYEERYVNYRSLYDYDQALFYFSRLIKLNPSPLLLRKRAALYHYRADMASCIADLEEALRRNPGDDPDLLCLLGNMYFINKDPEHARELFRKSIEIVGADAAASIMALANLLGSSGDREGAAALMEKYSFAHFDNCAYQKGLAQCLIAAGMASKAVLVYHKMAGSDLIDQDTLSRELLFVSAIGSPETLSGSLADYQRHFCEQQNISDPIQKHSLFSVRPNNDECKKLAHYCDLTGTLLFYSRDLKAAVKYLEYALKCQRIVKNEDSHIFRSLAIVYHLLGNRKKASEYASMNIRIMTAAPDLPADITAANKCDMGSEDYYLRSRECYNARRYTSLALMHLCMGDVDRCREYLDQTSNCILCPDCLHQECYESLIVRGYLAETEGNLADAVSCFKRAAAICPWDCECTLPQYFLSK